MRTKKHLLAWSLAGCLAAGGGIAVAAGQTQSGQQSSQGPAARSTIAAKKTSATATIIAIDRANRILTLQGEQGNVFTVDVPQKVARFDALKKGDRVSVNYYEALALSLQKGGAGATGARETTTVQRSPGLLPGGIATRKITATAKVLNVDRVHDTVTIEGASGKVQTIDVTDPQLQQRLANVQVGDQIQVTYMQAVAVDVTPRQQQQGQQQGQQPEQQQQMQPPPEQQQPEQQPEQQQPMPPQAEQPQPQPLPPPQQPQPQPPGAAQQPDR